MSAWLFAHDTPMSPMALIGLFTLGWMTRGLVDRRLARHQERRRLP